MDEPRRVYTSDGHQGVIVEATNEPSDDDHAARDVRFVEVEMEGGARLHVPAELLEPRPDGAFNLLVGYADVEPAPLRTAPPAEDKDDAAGRVV